MGPTSDTPLRPQDSGLLPRLLAELGLRPDTLTLPARAVQAVPLPSHLAVGELAWTSIGAAAAAIGTASADDDWHPLLPDPDLVADAYRSDRYLRVDGEAIEGFAPLSGFWRTADGWVRTHGNYAHHAAALRTGLRLRNGATPDEVASVLRTMTSVQAMTAVQAHGGLCVPVRQEAPREDAALRATPLIQVSRLGDSRPRALPRPTAASPLSGIRVLDLTRVIAGPVATRTLAFAGAEVLRLDPPMREEISWQHFDTGHGKRTALLDIAADRERFDALLADADVIVLGYRPDGLRRLGLDPQSLVSRHPQLVVAQLSAWPGDDSARGFDSIVQAACGISWADSVDGQLPGALPAQALDHSAGYLLAAGITAALCRRAEAGGSWYVRTSLRRVAAELLGMPRGEPRRAPEHEVRTQEFEVGGQRVTTVEPAVRWPGGPVRFAAPRPWGADAPEW